MSRHKRKIFTQSKNHDSSRTYSGRDQTSNLSADRDKKIISDILAQEYRFLFLFFNLFRDKVLTALRISFIMVSQLKTMWFLSEVGFVPASYFLWVFVTSI